MCEDCTDAAWEAVYDRDDEISRLKEELERTEAQNDNLRTTLEEDLLYQRTLEEEVSGLLARIATLEESVEYLRASRAEARAERDALRIELEAARDEIDYRDGYEEGASW